MGFEMVRYQTEFLEFGQWEILVEKATRVHSFDR